MFVISERINGLFTSMYKAIKQRDAKFIQDPAVRQVECSAQDVNVGPGRENNPAACSPFSSSF